ncbi:MAG: hypothetical protein ACT4PM_02750 [Gemmatimonadales bacterium]
MVTSLMFGVLLTLQPPQFPVAGFRQSVAALSLPADRPLVILPSQGETHRLRNAVIGGVIGGVAGVVTCTAISNAIDDPGTGFSTCTTNGYLLFRLGGFGLGALIGALIK